MGRPYSQDLRDRVLSAVDSGMSPAEVAELFEVNVSYVYKVLIRRRTTGSTTAPFGVTSATAQLGRKGLAHVTA